MPGRMQQSRHTHILCMRGGMRSTPTTSFLTLPTFAHDGAVHVVIESPRGSTSKFKYDPALNAITLSRPLAHGLAYPHDWGFVPSTVGEDGDPVDAMVLWDGTSYPGIVVSCRLIGVLQVEQTNQESGARERNDRLVVH